LTVFYSKENIPLEFRSIIGISKLLHGFLLRGHHNPSFSLSDYRCVQSISFPPHHQDPPDAVPKCRGFALVTFSRLSDTSHLLSHFPYDNRENNRIVDGDDDDPSAEELEARKAGFRTLSKERWEALQAEYVEYRDALLSRIATSSSASCSTAPAASIPTALADNVTDASVKARLQHVSEAPLNFPPGCVIFARHVPQDSNKTALRALFSASLADSSTTALDYVDYTKGLDTVRDFPCVRVNVFIMSLFE
jgi:xRRM domain